MLEKIKEKELLFMESWNNPYALIESLFHDFDNLGSFHKTKLGKLRLYQKPFISRESIIDFKKTAEMHKLNEKEEFQLRKNVATIYNLGARKYGKTCCTLKLDIAVSPIYDPGLWCALYSIDEKRLRGVLDSVKLAHEYHPVCRNWDLKCSYKPEIKFYSRRNHWKLQGVNTTPRSKDPGCFDDKTEILTENGWKFFKDLTYNDKVLSMNPETKIADYYNIKKIYSYDFNGKLYKLKNYYNEFLITKNHSLIHQNRKNLKFVKLSENNIPKQLYCPATVLWKGKNKKFINLKGIVNSKFKTEKYLTKDWVKFIAWYLSEGSLGGKKTKHYRIHIPQINNNLRLEKNLKNLNLHYTKTYDKKYKIYRYVINNKLIYLHLENYFGKNKNKRITSYFKELSQSLLKLFIDEYLMGDGNIYKGFKHIFTSLKILADDLQEIALKAGYKAVLRIKKQNIYFNDKEYKNYEMYLISLCSSKTSVFQKNEIKEEKYKGKIWDVEVEPYHTILVRRNGNVIWSGNSQFYQLHVKKLWGEEVSFETEVIYKKRKEAVSEDGVILRLAGMTDFTRHSPIGEVFMDKDNKLFVVNYPQCVSPKWDKNEKKDRIKAYGDENNPDYLVYVNGEIIEDSHSVFDMDRVRSCYLKDQLKRFSIKKDQVPYFKDLIVIERPKNANRIFVSQDVGDGSQSEIGIIAEIEDKYKWLYSITLFGLIGDEQEEILHWIIEQVGANVVAIDCGEALGRLFCDHLEKKFDKDNVVRYAGARKVRTSFELDDSGKVVIKKGEPIYKEEFMSEWSVARLMTLLYGEKLILPEDYKFDKQFTKVISGKFGDRRKYMCLVENKDDHVWAMWRVFAIAQWLKKDFNKTKLMKKERAIGNCSWIKSK